MDFVIGILLLLSFVGMVFYCIKGYNLMIGFILMATLWTVLPMIGHLIQPMEAFAGILPKDMLNAVYQTAPERWGGILVNVFFGAWFGRVLIETGIASTIIRKSVELGGDNPATILVLINIITGVIFTSMSGAGPVIAIAVIVLPILLSLGISNKIALFSFTGSVAAGVFVNPINFAQYQAFFADENGIVDYTYNDYFPFGIFSFVVMLIVVSLFACLYLKKEKPKYAWAAESIEAEGPKSTPDISLITPFLPVIGVIIFRLPVILCFILSGLFGLIVCKELKKDFRASSRILSKLFSDGVIDTASLVGFWLCLSTFNAAAAYAGPYFEVVIGNIIPSSAFWLCIVFLILAPLTWFRGPLSLIGCGAALLAVISQNPANYPTSFLYPLFISIMIGMGHFDITTSWIAWGMGYTKVTSKDYMRLAFIPGMIIAGILELATFFLFGRF